jgi:regulator of sigma E protease
LTLRDERTVEIEPAISDAFFNPERGFRPNPKKILRKAETWGDALPMALHETKDALLQVYAFLRKIGTQISPKGLGGPVTIFKAAGAAADEGLPDLLLFLTMLSANLAVINFLPIPLLDGGHMVLLTLEAIFRKPVSERVVGYFQWAGLIFILSLMVFVLSLDLGLLSRFPT